MLNRKLLDLRVAVIRHYDDAVFSILDSLLTFTLDLLNRFGVHEFLYVFWVVFFVDRLAKNAAKLTVVDFLVFVE